MGNFDSSFNKSFNLSGQFDLEKQICRGFGYKNKEEGPKRRIADLHMHVVPGVDDGSRSIDESLEMIKLTQSQGVTDIFCTSHNGYSPEDGERYLKAFSSLKERCKKEIPNINLHKGCEVLCSDEYIEDIIYGLDIGAFSTLGNSKSVLIELYPDARVSEAITVIKALTDHGYKPIIAHMERNQNITGMLVGLLVSSGALIQVNANSFVDESDTETRERARDLLKRGNVHFIGSDSHRIDHRAPNISSGAAYIENNVPSEIAEQILFGNAEQLILI